MYNDSVHVQKGNYRNGYLQPPNVEMISLDKCFCGSYSPINMYIGNKGLNMN